MKNLKILSHDIPSTNVCVVRDGNIYVHKYILSFLNKRNINCSSALVSFIFATPDSFVINSVLSEDDLNIFKNNLLNELRTFLIKEVDDFLNPKSKQYGFGAMGLKND